MMMLWIVLRRTCIEKGFQDNWHHSSRWLETRVTVKSRVQYTLVYNTQGDFSLLSLGKIKVYVYNMRWLLLKSFSDGQVACITSMSILHPASQCQRQWVDQVS